MEGRMAKKGTLGIGHSFVIFVCLFVCLGMGCYRIKEEILFYFTLLLPFFWLCYVTCGILVPPPGIEPGPSVVKAQSPNHWTAREFPRNFLFAWNKFPKVVARCSWLFRLAASGRSL